MSIFYWEYLKGRDKLRDPIICRGYSYLLQWNRALLVKLIGSQIVKKFPAYYGTRRFITAFTTARQPFVFWVREIQSITSYPTSWRCISILSSHLRLGLPSIPFPSGFPAKTLYVPLLSPTVLHDHSSQFDHLNNIWWAVQIIKLLIM